MVAFQRIFRRYFFTVYEENNYLLCTLESIREVRKYSEPIDIEDLKHHPEAETMYHMKLFRAQRNLYIAGFALFLQLWVWRY